MQKLALGALFVGLVACGKSNPTHVIDSGGIDGSGGGGACDPVLQTGCTGDASTPRCTWVQDTASIGHDGCEDAGTIALGQACGRDGSGSGYPEWDNCDSGSLCVNGTCEAICDSTQGAAACGSGFFCQIYDGLFEINGATTDGVCDPQCDPLADNSFGTGSDTLPLRTGTSCGSAGDGFGCYGEPGSDTNNPTHFTCSGEGVTTDVHRSACLPGSAGDACAPAADEAYLNGCAQGYGPTLLDQVGSTTVDCIAWCQPQDCFAGSNGSASNCPGLGAAGVAPHACQAGNIRMATGYTPPGGGLNQCLYMWTFEEGSDGSGNYYIANSDYDDYGFCYDDSIYKVTGSDGSDYAIACDTLPGSGSDGPQGFVAAELGCVSIETATAQGYFGSGSGSGAFRVRSHQKHNPFRDIRFPTVMHRTASLH